MLIPAQQIVTLFRVMFSYEAFSACVLLFTRCFVFAAVPLIVAVVVVVVDARTR